jgi:outer membrane protein assembly factor BamE (lipoprotein component of BamABCDE complex)
MADSTESSMRFIKWAAVASVIFSVLASIAFFTWWAMKDRFVFGGQQFNQVQWITAMQTPDNRCHRGDMAYDIKTNVLKPGMTRDATLVLLGRPTWEDAQHTEYDLGYCHWDTHGLYLFFNQQNLLLYTRIAQH